MVIYSIGLATDCTLDDDFFELMEQAAKIRGITTYKVYPYNLDETLFRIKNNQIHFLTYYDRASDTSTQFLKLNSALSTNKVIFFEDLDKQKLASDKSIIHEQFVKNELDVPETLVIPALNVQPEIDLMDRDLDQLGKPFVIKPAINTGSGVGVHLEAYTLSNIAEIRKENPEDKYLVQEKIYPKEKDQRLFWFRTFYVCGTIINTWWDIYSHRYEPLTYFNTNDIDMIPLEIIMKKIHVICGLNFFSSELTITKENKIYVIDYINEICDMRLQSKYFDGVPDEIVRIIAAEIVEYLMCCASN
jgi:hypothetical protein